MKKKIIIGILIFILILIGICIVQNKEENNNPVNIEEQQNQAEQSNKNEEEQTTELFEKYYKQAEEIMNTMTIEEKVGQMFLVRYPKTSPISQIKQENPGGYILFSVDFDNKTKDSLKQELENNQANSKVKMFFAVDEEGGTVVRVSSHKAFRDTKFESPQQVFKKGGLDAIVDDSNEKSDLLKSIGLNMNLAPVADITPSTSDFIYARTFGKGAEETAEYISKVIQAMNEKNIVSSMKHFPGYGNNVDTHTGIAIDKRTYESFTTTDFLPFQSGIEANAPTIMVNHNIVKCMDENMPASLSSNVHKILREELGFSGLILTDDLAMDAVKSYADNGQAAVAAVKAGNDMIITSDFKTQKQQVLSAISKGEISEETINIAVRRILACKLAYGII